MENDDIDYLSDNEENELNDEINHIPQNLNQNLNGHIQNSNLFLSNDNGFLTDTQYDTDTDDEDNNDRYTKLFNFLYTEIQRNDRLYDYLINDVGFVDSTYIQFISEDNFNQIYNLLNEKQKKDMKKNYLYTIRQLLHNPDFDLTTVGGKSRKFRKSRKSRKYRK